MSAQKLPWDIKQQILWIVRGYERTRREYTRQRAEILDIGGGDHFTEYIDERGRKCRAALPGSKNASRTAENIALKLAGLENSQSFRQMRAVEHARAKIGAGMPEGLADALRDAIMLNCKDGRKYPFERLYIVGLGRSEFYRIRDAFFLEIAKEVGIW